MAVTLVESFVAKRDKDIWNDFVAVFRKGRITKTLPKVFIYEHVACTDVITWKSKDILNPSEQTEDVILLTKVTERAHEAENELAQVATEREVLAQEMTQLRTRLAAVENESQGHREEAGDLKGELNLRCSELRQRQEEIEQTRSELLETRSRIDELRTQLEARLEAQRELNVSALEQLRERELELIGKKGECESLRTTGGRGVGFGERQRQACQ